MNFSLSVLSLANDAVDSYPCNDETAFFADYLSQLSGRQLVIVAREGILYYAYFRPLDECNFGLVVGVKDVRAQNPGKLFDVLDNFVSRTMPASGRVICYDDRGNLGLANVDFSDNVEAYTALYELLSSTLQKSERRVQWKSESTNFMPANHGTEDVALGAASPKVYDIINKGKIAVIHAGDNYCVDATEKTMHNLRDSLTERETQIAELSDEVHRLERTRKQYRNVLILFALLLLGGVGLYIQHETLKTTGEKLRLTGDSLQIKTVEAEKLVGQVALQRDSISGLTASYAALTVSKRQDSLNFRYRSDSLKTVIWEKSDSLSTEKRLANQFKRRYDDVLIYSSGYPMFVKTLSSRGASLYITYNCIKSGHKEIFVVLYKNDNEAGRAHVSTTLESGINKELKINDIMDLTNADFAIVECDGKVIGGGRIY